MAIFTSYFDITRGHVFFGYDDFTQVARISLTHRIHGAAIYGVPWIPSIYPLYVSIYTSTMDPMGY